MFQGITIKNGIVHKDSMFTFQKGTTAITGPNGSGKSLLAEFMAFSLFGTVALRGKTSDYKGLEVTARVNIRGNVYIIHRSLKDCEIKRDGQIVCVGTKACNTKIIEELGYNYNVYKMSNYAEQIDILGFGKMKPAEKKQAVDTVLGLGVIDFLVKTANEKALRFSHEAEGMMNVLTEPEKPQEPENYQHSKLWYDLYDYQKKCFEEAKEARQFCDWYESMPRLEKPVEPCKKNSLEISQDLLKKDSLKKEILHLKGVPDVSYTKEELDKISKDIQAYENYKNALAAAEVYKKDDPEIDLVSAEKGITAWKDYNLYLETKRLYEMGEVSCPKCGHKFNPSIATVPQKVPEPSMPMKYYEEQKQLCEWREKYLAMSKDLEKVAEPAMTREILYITQQQFLAKENALINIPIYEKELEEVNYATPGLLQLRSQYEVSLAQYNSNKDELEKAKEKYDNYKKQAIMDDKYLAEVEERLQETSRKYQEALFYERMLEKYTQEYDVYLVHKNKFESFREASEKYKKAVENLKDMKSKIKQYVLPSLAKVASRLLFEMSDRLFQSVTIDSDFNVLVDGREISLFSGSEQAMINLALRLGLGQVLTHKAFNVFIGDEIDASMSEERARLTADCLKKISKYIDQIILISHRGIEADHYITLGE